MVVIKAINIFMELVFVSGNPNLEYKNITANPAEQPNINAITLFLILLSFAFLYSFQTTVAFFFEQILPL